MSTENNTQPAATASDQQKIDDLPHKVFVGNLAFKTTEDELKDFFTDVATVVKVNIITRGARSLGYGFVAFATAADCDAAVEKCHKKELDGREINVEVAKPKSDLYPKRERRPPAPRAPGRRPPPRRRSGRKRSTSPRQQDTEDGVVVSHGSAGDAEKKPEDSEEKKELTAKKKNKPKKAPRDPDAPRPPRPPRVHREPTGEPSKTTVFIANLPFSMDDTGLMDLFKEYKVKTAKVVIRRGTTRSKGFGFVDLETEEEQKRLLEAPAFEADGRMLSIKVALSEDRDLAETSEEPKKEEEEEV